jgi:membrane protease YdiL (CAAX protease family)
MTPDLISISQVLYVNANSHLHIGRTPMNTQQSDLSNPHHSNPEANMIESFSTEPLILAGIFMILAFLGYGALRQKAERDAVANDATGTARLKVYSHTQIILWFMAAVCTLSWLASGRSFTQLGFRSDPSLQFWIMWGLSLAVLAYFVWQIISMAMSRKARDEFRKQIAKAGSVDVVLPHTQKEHNAFQWLSLTAGITEEIIFRGFLIGALSIWLPLWGAAIAATALFVLAHAYQGLPGMMRILPISAVLAAVFVISGSLWPVILLHIIGDMAAGRMCAIAQHHEGADQSAIEQAQTSPA